MKERIVELMRLEGLTSVKFAEILSVQPSNISHILSGRNNPSYDFILKLIERFPSVNIEWIMTGNGDVYKSNLNQNQLCDINVNYDQLGCFTSVNSVDFNLADSESRLQSDIPTHQIEESLNRTQATVAFNDTTDQKPITTDKEPKQVKKIILFYTDNSFEIFNS